MPQSSADIIYINGNIWTGVSDAPRVEAIAVKGQEIVAVGTEADVAALRGSETKIINLGGSFVVPGFIDNHTHLMSGGFQLVSVDLRDAASPDEFIRRIKDFALRQPQGKWITGGRWDHEKWGGELPHSTWIDSITRDNPVFISRVDGHMGLANSTALKLAGIGVGTPDPEGGTIVRDADTGEPTGILKDEAMSLIFELIPEPSKQELDEALERATEYALSQGVTQVHDMCSWRDFETYRHAEERGALRVRIYPFVWHTALDHVVKHLAEYGRGSDWLRLGGVKGMVDGSLGSTTAWLYEPYLDAPWTAGLMVTDTAELRAFIDTADKAGLQVAVHAIGDRANDWVLDVYQEVLRKHGTRDRRFRVEHAQHLSKKAIRRFASLGVIPSMQPYHCIDDGRWAEKRIGPDLVRRTYAFRSLLDTGAKLTFGSDWTVAPISPLEGIYAAVTRRTLDGKHPNGWVPEEKITVEEALKCYTLHNAYAGFQEDRLGTLEPGKLADFVVLSKDLFAIDPVEIPKVVVLRTVVGGIDRFVAQGTW